MQTFNHRVLSYSLVYTRHDRPSAGARFIRRRLQNIYVRQAGSGMRTKCGLCRCCPRLVMSYTSLSARLVNQKPRLSPTNRATHLCKCNGVADPLKHAITITIKNLYSAPPYVLSHRIWSFYVTCIRISRWEPPKLGSAGLLLLERGRDWPLEINPSPRVIRCTEFGRSRSNGSSIMKEILKNLTPRIPPCKVTQGHRNRHASALLWLPIWRSIATMVLSLPFPR